MGASIRDVAREAGVSPATVSRALNGHGKVSDQAKRRVLAAVRKLHYQSESRVPDTTRGYQPTVVLTIPSLANPFSGELAEGAEKMARSLGYRLVVVNTGYDPHYQFELIVDLYDQGVEGFLVASSLAQDKLILDLVQEGYPVVTLTKEAVEHEVHCVINDDFRGGMLATNHFIEAGHRNISAIMMPKNVGNPERIRGYTTAMELAGLGQYIRILDLNDESIHDGYRVALSALENQDMTAILAHNDIVAAGVLQACKERTRRVPHDISVIGYDGTILASVTDPPLTTIVQPTSEIGSSGMKLLHEMMTSDIVQSVHKIVLQPSLRPGGTTAAPVKSSV